MIGLRRLALGAAIAGALAGCAPGRPTGPAVNLVPPASAPAPTPGQDWFFHTADGEARLAYGTEASDEMRLGLACLKGTGALQLSAPGPAGGPAEIHLESGGDTERFPAEREALHLGEGDYLTAEARSDGPVFQRFRRLGWIARLQPGARDAYAAHPGSIDGVERFFSFCG